MKIWIDLSFWLKENRAYTGMNEPEHRRVEWDAHNSRSEFPIWMQAYVTVIWMWSWNFWRKISNWQRKSRIIPWNWKIRRRLACKSNIDVLKIVAKRHGTSIYLRKKLTGSKTQRRKKNWRRTLSSTNRTKMDLAVVRKRQSMRKPNFYWTRSLLFFMSVVYLFWDGRNFVDEACFDR